MPKPELWTIQEAKKPLKRSYDAILRAVEALGLGLRTQSGFVILSAEDIETLRKHKTKRGRPRVRPLKPTKKGDAK